MQIGDQGQFIVDGLLARFQQRDAFVSLADLRADDGLLVPARVHHALEALILLTDIGLGDTFEIRKFRLAVLDKRAQALGFDAQGQLLDARPFEIFLDTGAVKDDKRLPFLHDLAVAGQNFGDSPPLQMLDRALRPPPAPLRQVPLDISLIVACADQAMNTRIAKLTVSSVNLISRRLSTSSRRADCVR